MSLNNINTEEDTFLALARLPFEEVRPLYDRWWHQSLDAWKECHADKFLKPYGWTYDALWRAANPGNTRN